MSEADCWELFSKYAFNNVEPSLYPQLKVIGREIVKKCKGNPLAVKSLACLLRSELNPREWKNVLVNDIWELDQRHGVILPALWLSYYYLPRHLKPCFAYCSIIPKDYQFEKEKLMLLWMAENLLQPQNNMMLEEVGEKYFEDLTSKSFFIVDEDNRFTMHDLVNDLAKFVSGKSCLRLDDDFSGNLTSETCRISCILYDTGDISKKLEDLSENRILRTLLVLDDGDWCTTEKQYKINRKELQSMQYLRVLCASRNFFGFEGRTKLIKLIGRLKLLRYLDLSYAEMKEIPDSICKLYNLQTLLLRYCRNLVRLPYSIGNLKHLRYLDASSSSIEKIPDSMCKLHELRTLSLVDCVKITRLPTNFTMLTNLCKLDTFNTRLKEMPPKISNLINLQSLSDFLVGKSNGIEELGEFSDLHGRLCIGSLENVEEVEDVSKANLKNKNYITDLSLGWNDDSTNVSHNKAREVLVRLQPHTNIEKLRIRGYGGSSFPDWIGHHSFSRLKKLMIIRCHNCGQLPPLGELPSLESLEIVQYGKVERIGDEFYLNDLSFSSCVTEPPFKSLKKLKFYVMQEWKEWSSVGRAFQNLKKLTLWHCPKLKGECLPDIDLPSLERLVIGNHHLMASLSRCQYPLLRLLKINECPGMKSFPQGRLPSTIQAIEIWSCDDLVSLSEEGWPCSNLKSLEITYCDKLFANSSNKWNLGMLTSLTSLLIGNVNMKSFPEEEGQLPTTLTCLRLYSLTKLKSLNGMALRRLTSLQTLRISDCEQLQCLPEERLPASLYELSIFECPLLKPRCQRGLGQDWDKIKNITRLDIQGS